MFSGPRWLKPILLNLLPLTVALIAAAGCGPKQPSERSNGFSPTPQINFEEDAQPTLVTPPPQNDVEYQPAPDVVTNNGTQIFLNRTVLTSPRMHYSSAQKQLTLTGQLAIMDENRNKLIEKSFSLSGTHTAQNSDFSLNDQIPTPEGSDLRIKGIAHCLNTDSNDNILCDHVVVDVIAQYNGRYYSEQVEVNRNSSPTQPQLRPTAPPAPPASADPTEDENEDPDQDQTGMQPEGDDETLQGRYQGSIEVIDLSQLFADEQPQQPSPEIPPPAPPATGTSDDSSATPPDAPSGDSSRAQPEVPPITPAPPATPPSQDQTRRDEPRNEEPSAPPAPPAPTVEAGTCNRNVSPNIAQMRNGNVRPCNQAVGLPANGQLRDPVSMVTRSESLGRRAYFVVASPNLNKHFATYEMAEMIIRAGAMMNQRYEKRVYLSRVSARRGGRLPPSVSHQIGNDVDLGYPNNGSHMFPLVVERRTGTYHARNYSVEKTYNLFKYLFSQQDIVVERIFVDRKIKDALCTYAKSQNEHTGRDRELVRRMFSNLQHIDGHGDHFHMRIRCSRLDPGCRSHQYRRVSTCE